MVKIVVSINSRRNLTANVCSPEETKCKKKNNSRSYDFYCCPFFLSFSLFWTWKSIFFSSIEIFGSHRTHLYAPSTRRFHQPSRIHISIESFERVKKKFAPCAALSELSIYIYFLDSSLYPLVEPWENPTLLYFHFVLFSFLYFIFFIFSSFEL